MASSGRIFLQFLLRRASSKLPLTLPFDNSSNAIVKQCDRSCEPVADMPRKDMRGWSNNTLQPQQNSALFWVDFRFMRGRYIESYTVQCIMGRNTCCKAYSRTVSERSVFGLQFYPIIKSEQKMHIVIYCIVHMFPIELRRSTFKNCHHNNKRLSLASRR